MSFKLNKVQKKVLSKYLQILRRNYREQIMYVMLFGSVARGDSDLESDIDILIVTANGDQKLKDEISMVCFDLILKNNLILSPLVMDNGTYEWHKRYHDPLYNNIQKEGIDLWTKKPEFL